MAKRKKAGTSRPSAAHRREKFVTAFLKNGENGTQAAIAAGYAAHSARVTAAQLLADPNIRRAVENARQVVREAGKITLEKLTEQLMMDRAFARKNKSASAAVAATMGIARVCGFMVEDRKNELRPYEGMTEEELDRAIAETARTIERLKTAPFSADAGAPTPAGAK